MHRISRGKEAQMLTDKFKAMGLDAELLSVVLGKEPGRWATLAALLFVPATPLQG